MSASPPELNYTYTVAGFRILTNRSVESPGALSNFNDSVQIVFTRSEVNLSEVGCLFGKTEFSGDWYYLPHSSPVPVYFRSDGRAVIIHEPDAVTLDHTAQLRRAIPFAAALQKKLVLHASAVCTDHEVISFIGPSRSGKTSMAERLNTLGFPPITDDLLPCRTSGHKVVIPVANDSISSPLELPFTRIYFLDRDETLKQINLVAVSKHDCFLALLRHGFGELPVSKVWKTQFVSYHIIAEQVQAYRLQIPLGARYLDETARILAQNTPQLERSTRD